ncbi:MAG: hypothetical protein RL481_1852, partial [Pseudomonadota bacterium]
RNGREECTFGDTHVTKLPSFSFYCFVDSLLYTNAIRQEEHYTYVPGLGSCL